MTCARSTDSYLKWALFIFWPLIGMILLCGVAIVIAVAWLVIPFGHPTMEGNSWTLKFPWSK